MKAKAWASGIALAIALGASVAHADPPRPVSPVIIPTVREQPAPLKTAGWITVASGVGALATGELMMYFGNKQAGSAAAADDPSREEYNRRRERAVAFHDTGDVLLATGAVATVVGLSLVLFAPRDSQTSARLEVGPSQVSMTGSF